MTKRLAQALVVLIALSIFFSAAGRVQGLGIFRPGTASSVWKQ